MARAKPGLHFGKIILLAVSGALLLVVGLLLPAHWKSLSPVVIERAGRGTPTVVDLGLTEVVKEKPGTASLLLVAAESTDDPQVEKLSSALANLNSQRPELIPWGGSDAPLMRMHVPGAARTAGTSVPVVELFLPEATRQSLRDHLQKSPSPGVAAILKTRELAQLHHFIPVTAPGGQPFDATILFTAFLYEGERFTPAMTQEIKVLAERATSPAGVEAWENALLDMLALGRRLNWTQAIELLRHVPDAQSLNLLASAARQQPESFPVVYAACLLTQSPGKVGDYLTKHGTAASGYLTTALPHGQGAVDLLLKRQLPVGRGHGQAMAFTAPLAWKSPWLALALKAVFFVLAMTCFFLVWQILSVVDDVEDLGLMSPVSQLRRVSLTVGLVVLLMVVSEPFLFSHAGAAGMLSSLNLPVISNSPVSPTPNPSTEPRSLFMHLDLSTILSVALFAALQIIVYAICLMKIQEIDRHSASPQLKLRLLENEENLFDSGLYVGIAGTAAALILQVLQVIEANLLAAYSSNLFGILCVAFVKIRHVRAYKRRLILQSQRERELEIEREREREVHTTQPLSHVTA